MNKNEFEQFVLENGKDILRFCRMTTGNEESGNDLYQDTKLKLLEKRNKLNLDQNVKSYALSISILLWKNKKKKYAVRNNIVKFTSLDEIEEEEGNIISDFRVASPEQEVLTKSEVNLVQKCVAELPEKIRMPLYLSYSANMKLEEIANTLHIPLGTTKSRIRKAKAMLKDRLEAIGYDG